MTWTTGIDQSSTCKTLVLPRACLSMPSQCHVGCFFKAIFLNWININHMFGFCLNLQRLTICVVFCNKTYLFQRFLLLRNNPPKIIPPNLPSWLKEICEKVTRLDSRPHLGDGNSFISKSLRFHNLEKNLMKNFPKKIIEASWCFSKFSQLKKWIFYTMPEVQTPLSKWHCSQEMWDYSGQPPASAYRSKVPIW